jgi:hypothetical protein
MFEGMAAGLHRKSIKEMLDGEVTSESLIIGQTFRRSDFLGVRVESSLYFKLKNLPLSEHLIF